MSCDSLLDTNLTIGQTDGLVINIGDVVLQKQHLWLAASPARGMRYDHLDATTITTPVMWPTFLFISCGGPPLSLQRFVISAARTRGGHARIVQEIDADKGRRTNGTICLR